VWPEPKVQPIKIAVVFCVLEMGYIGTMALLTATAAQNSMMCRIARDSSLLYFAYWLPSFVHLLSVVMAFTYGRKALLILSACLGSAAIFWHLANMILFYLLFEWSDMGAAINGNMADAILWWAEMILALVIVACTLEVSFA